MKNGPCGPIFSNRSQIGQYIGSCQFAENDSNGFTRNIKKFSGATIVKCVKARPQRVKFVGHFGLPK